MAKIAEPAPDRCCQPQAPPSPPKLNTMCENSTKTDLDCFVELYKRFGITCVVNKGMCYDTQKPFYEATKQQPGYTIYLGTYEGDASKDTYSNKFDGYGGFYSEVIFDENGKFLKQNFLE